MTNTVLKDSTIILVYTAGKVGSKTIVHSLNNSIKNKIYDVHHLTQKRINLEIEFCRRFSIPLYPGIKDAQYLTKLLSDTDKVEWKVITLVRDPLSQSVAGFFQNIHYHFDDFVKRYNARLINDKTINHYLQIYGHPPLEHIASWLDTEIKTVFCIDVFHDDFCKEKGYKIYKNNNVELLLIRLEDLNKCAEDAFYDFLGIENFKLQNENMASQKDYYDAYVKFKTHNIFKKDDLDKIYNSRYIKHFYSEEEIKQFRKRWREV
ncbi:putative capsular polysaccharide synthesis family protein [Metabacillus herbersteinensis]|uniref:Capsular polysaccharide synthesis family protein n=1 Tax=Metabacillus herbersteinensis TaxID=283816 RepID=A0ABV6GE28_9BACI